MSLRATAYADPGSSPVATKAAKTEEPSRLSNLYSGFSEWVSKHSILATLVIVGIIICTILVAVLPPVCVLHGCGAGHGDKDEGAELPVKRLLVHFDELGKTVKARVSPLLYDYFEEIVLSFGVNIVTFKSQKVLQQVQRILESQPDVLILLQDRPQYQAPTIDPYRGFGLRGSAADSAPRRRELQVSGGAEPGDELSPEQWSLEKVAARDAWSLSRGERVVVAVVDTGCDLEHPDLRANIWVNPREIPGNNLDDDGNGFKDDVNGFDFAGPCEDPTGPGCGRRPNPQDAKGHGSHCSGIIGAVRNNRVGIVGIAPNVSIMCLKVTPNNGVFYTGQNLQAIDYAIKNGAHIISCSFGPVKPSTNLTDAQRAELRNETALYQLSLAALKQKNMLLVAAAGNELTNLDAVEHYNPCTLVRSFPENVLCVMATDDLDQRLRAEVQSPPQGSNYGANTVSVGAPGLQILSTVPALFAYNYSRWTNMSGSSMATPLVAGVAALVLSILGSKDGNFYKGSTANGILMDSGNFVPNLEVFRSRRINASAAVQMALARVAGVTLMIPQADLTAAERSAMMQGFNLTYYGSTTPEPDPNSVMDESTMASRVSRFDGYKQNNGTLVIQASMNLSTPGMYLIQVNTSARAGDLRVFVGQAELRDLSQSYLLRSDGGWYAFEVRYLNPVAPIDVMMAAPNSGGARALGYLPSVFFISTDAPPRSFYYAPNIALSSTWQVLTRDTTGPLRGSRIQSSALQLNQPYNNSAVLESINFTSTSSPRLGDALRLRPNSLAGLTGSQQQVVGLAHTRMRAPDGTSGSLRFKITCELCALYVNGLRVADVYDPVKALEPATQLTNCVTLGAGGGGGGSAALHELLLRFAVRSADNGSLAVSWLPCDGDDSGYGARPLGPFLMNNLFWQPSGGVAGYVAGMQCDVWLNRPGEGPAKDWLPLIKFRLPTALAQTTAGVARTLPTLLTRSDPPVYDIINASRCSANETAAGPGSNCSAAVAFVLTHIVNRGQDLSISSSPVYMRCWTYVNAGFGNGTVQTLKAGEINVHLGAQTVLRSPSTSSIFFPSVAPNTTALGNYYQLLVVEFPSLRLNALSGLRNGTGGAGGLGSLMLLDTARTLLPLPLVGSSGGAAVRAPPAARGARQRRRRRRRRRHLLQQEAPGSASDPAAEVRVGEEGEVVVEEEEENEVEEGTSGEEEAGVRRGLQQPQPQPQPQAVDAASGNVFRPTYVGANPYAIPGSPPGTNPGLCGISFTPNADYNAATLQLPTVLYNLSLTPSPIRGTPCVNASAGLSDPVCFQQPNRTFPRFVQARGFIRVPAAAAATAAAGGGTMRRWTLRVIDDPGQTTAITIGDVTVRNGVEHPSSAMLSSETSIFLPAAATGDVYLPAVVTARSRVIGSQAVFDVALLAPETRAAWRVNASLWYCS